MFQHGSPEAVALQLVGLQQPAQHWAFDPFQKTQLLSNIVSEPWRE